MVTRSGLPVGYEAFPGSAYEAQLIHEALGLTLSDVSYALN